MTHHFCSASVSATQGVTTTVYVGNYYELSVSGGITSTVKYYYAGGSRIAMRQDGGAVKWLLGDHLGSASVAANSDGSLSSRQGYKAWGETRFGSLPTKYQYTGQMNEPALGLYYYGARWYDASLGRWIQPDTIVPEDLQGIQAWDRYAYTNNNPLRFIDPTGHVLVDPGKDHDYYWEFLYREEKDEPPTPTPSSPVLTPTSIPPTGTATPTSSVTPTSTASATSSLTTSTAVPYLIVSPTTYNPTSTPGQTDTKTSGYDIDEIWIFIQNGAIKFSPLTPNLELFGTNLDYGDAIIQAAHSVPNPVIWEIAEGSVFVLRTVATAADILEFSINVINLIPRNEFYPLYEMPVPFP